MAAHAFNFAASPGDGTEDADASFAIDASDAEGARGVSDAGPLSRACTATSPSCSSPARRERSISIAPTAPSFGARASCKGGRRCWLERSMCMPTRQSQKRPGYPSDTRLADCAGERRAPLRRISLLLNKYVATLH